MKQNDVPQVWKARRDWWLDHFFLYQPGDRRRSNRSKIITPNDYVAIPAPMNVPTGAAGPCLIWRWGLDSYGYGRLSGKGTHVLAFEATRPNRDPDLNVLHLCHRPFCVQPSHLYNGDNRQNAEDSKAFRSRMNMYQTIEAHGQRLRKALEVPGWPDPNLEGTPVGFGPALECPHEFVISAGDIKLCRNCMEYGGTDDNWMRGHRDPCSWEVESYKCRCEIDPCSCNYCLHRLWAEAQQCHDWHQLSLDPVYREIGRVVEDFDAPPLPREKARIMRRILESYSSSEIRQSARTRRNTTVRSHLDRAIIPICAF